MLWKNKKINKATLTLVFLIFIFSNLFIFGWNVPTSYAQFVVYDPILHTYETSTNMLSMVWNQIKAIFFKNVVGVMANKIAEQSAIWVASGGNGTKPQFITDFKQFTQGIADAAIGQMVQTILRDTTGLDVCTLDPRLAINIALSVPNFPGYVPPKPACTWTQMVNHWEEIGKSQLITFNVTLQPGGTFGQNVQTQQSAVQGNPILQCWIPALQPYVGGGSCSTIGCTPPANSADIYCSNKPKVQTDLETAATALASLSSNDLASDIKLMTDNALSDTNVNFSIGIGQYAVVPENIPIIRDKWLAKIDAQEQPLNDIIAKYNPCQGAKATDFISGGHCSPVANDLGLSISNTDLGGTTNTNLSGSVSSQMSTMTSYVLTNAQSIKSGFDYLKSQVTQYFSPDAFQGGLPYNAAMAKDLFDPSAFQFNAYETMKDQINKVGLQKYVEQQTNLIVSQGWKSATDKIGGYIETPSDLLREKAANDLVKKDIAAAYTNNIAADALGVFLQTLWNQYMQRLLQGLANPKQAETSKAITLTQPGASTSSSTSAFSQDIVTPEGVAKYIQDIGKQFQASYTYKDVDLLADFQMQITGLVNPNIYNNVIDSNFAQAINAKQTIQEAIDAGRLIGSYRFSWSDPAESGTYNLANIKKLRKARAVPIGLEMAVELIRDCSQKPVGPLCTSDKLPAGANPSDIAQATLQDVVKGFDQSGDGICGNLDSGESPFCNLVNPNWVLKIPLTKCSYESDIEPYGEILQSNNSSQRYSRCTDFASCLQEDGRGGCANGQYGFCVKEKNVWRIGAPTCPSDYDSCTSYSTTQNGTTSTVSYLKNTLSGSGICGADNAGCQAYAYERNCASPVSDANCTWNKNKTIYLDGNAGTCDSTSEGCSLFWPNGDLKTAIGEKTPLYYRKPPSYLGCTGSATDDPLCKNFMQVCNAAEVGCQLYKPTNGDPNITAVATSTDLCPAECVGYDVFVQQPTAYDPLPANSGYNYFIPSAATACAQQEVGCSQFTNLDEVSQGGEGIHYYTYLKQCIKPGLGLGEKNYFTWQGTVTGSPKIIRYQLKQDSAGAPATIDKSGNCDTVSNPNCLEFFDDQGNKYSRDVSMTISVSDDCHPYRKLDSDAANCGATNGTSQFVCSDSTITSQIDCESAGKTWSFSACIYNAIPSENLACSAAAVGCRAYTGNQGNNVFNLINDDFETGDTAGWSAGTLSTESLNLGGHSLLVGSDGTSKSAPLVANNLYTVSFWARTYNDSGENISLGFAGSSKNFLITSVFENFTLGPISVTADNSSNNLLFSGVSQNIYLDNIVVKSISDQIDVVKDSWKDKMPASCDTPTVGAMLGCRAYQNSTGQTFYFKSFTNLCADNKVGCQLLIDTQNSLSPDSQTFSQSNNPADDYIVPADAQDATYVLNDNFKCLPPDLGCQMLGQPNPKNSVSILNVFLKNNPDQYVNVANPIMCSAEAVGCVQLTNSTGSSEYYKIDSNKICNFDEQSGHWLLGGSGCYSSKYPTPNCQFVNGDCVDKSSGQGTNCTVDSVTGKCVEAGDQYKIFTTIDPITGLVNPNYAGYVGACPDKYNGCTRFGTYSQPANAQPEKLLDDEDYYVLDSGNNLDRSSCTAVNWDNGCVKFKNYDLGSPEILKVVRDRDCAEWLTCTQKDANGFCQKTALCDHITNGVCDDILQPCQEYNVTCNHDNWSTCETCLINNSCSSPDNCSACDPLTLNGSTFSCPTIIDDCRKNGTCVMPQPNCQSNSNNCQATVGCELDGLGNCVSVYDKLKDNVRYNSAGVGIPIERIAAANQGYIFRMASGSALATDLTTWQAGDYSGYSIPDRYPLETELENTLGSGFSLYPKVNNIGLQADLRYTEPICKAFPAADSPMPYEMTYISKNSQLTSLYSPSYQVNLQTLGDMCSYAEVTASGLTTYFPLSMEYQTTAGDKNYVEADNNVIYYDLSSASDVNSICTTPTYRQGKWCSKSDCSNYANSAACSQQTGCIWSNNSCVTADCPYGDSSPADSSSSCSKVDSVKIYNGVENMCLEYDTLSPIYADIYKTSYDTMKTNIPAPLYTGPYGPYTCSNATISEASVYTNILAGNKERSDYCLKNNGFYDNGSSGQKYNYQPYACLTYFPLAIDTCPYYKDQAHCLNNPACNWGFCYSFDSATGKLSVQSIFQTRVACMAKPPYGPGYFWSNGPCLRRK